MAKTKLHDLYIHELKDTLSAEAQITKALPKVIDAITDPDLKKALEDHLNETKEHVKIVKKVIQRHDEKASAEHCDGMEGLLTEGESAIEDFDKGSVRDCALIACCQKVEHYEICAYGTMRAMASSLGYSEDITDLTAVLHQESQADDTLSQLAYRLNETAKK